jgi:hypothetical protein
MTMIAVFWAGTSGAVAAAGANAAATVGETFDASDPALVRRWGVRVEGVRLSAAGYMLDFRYRVVDARKAKPLFARKAKPVLTDEATGALMSVPVPPKTGALRNSDEPKAGRTYFMFFANPGRFIAPGGRVTLAIGPFRVSGLRVEGGSGATAAAR